MHCLACADFNPINHNNTTYIRTYPPYPLDLIRHHTSVGSHPPQNFCVLLSVVKWDSGVHKSYMRIHIFDDVLTSMRQERGKWALSVASV
jgi:hypothetical protein